MQANPCPPVSVCSPPVISAALAAPEIHGKAIQIQKDKIMVQSLQELQLKDMSESQLMKYLLPEENLDELNPSQRKTILALRRIIQNYMKFIPRIKNEQINGSKDVLKIAHPMIKGKNSEEMWLMTLNASLKMIDMKMMSCGGINATIIDVKSIMKKAVMDQATAIIIIHNHPSGNPNPSDSDIKSTKKLKDACKTFEIMLADHLIISNDKYYSFNDGKIANIKL